MHPNHTKIVEDAIESLALAYAKLEKIELAIQDTLDELPEDDDDLRDPVIEQLQNLQDGMSNIDEGIEYLKKVLE